MSKSVHAINRRIWTINAYHLYFSLIFLPVSRKICIKEPARVALRRSNVRLEFQRPTTRPGRCSLCVSITKERASSRRIFLRSSKESTGVETVCTLYDQVSRKNRNSLFRRGRRKKSAWSLSSMTTTTRSHRNHMGIAAERNLAPR